MGYVWCHWKGKMSARRVSAMSKRRGSEAATSSTLCDVVNALTTLRIVSVPRTLKSGTVGLCFGPRHIKPRGKTIYKKKTDVAKWKIPDPWSRELKCGGAQRKLDNRVL